MTNRYTVRRHETACWIVDNFTGKTFTPYPLNQIDLLRAQARRMNAAK